MGDTKQFTDEQIIEIFKYCAESDCDDCYNCVARKDGRCAIPDLDAQVIKVISRKQAELERWKEEAERWKEEAEKWKDAFYKSFDDEPEEVLKKTDKMLEKIERNDEKSNVTFAGEFCNNGNSNNKTKTDVKEVRHGKWIIKNNELHWQDKDYYSLLITCSECGLTHFLGTTRYANEYNEQKFKDNNYDKYLFCGKCGAKMDKE